MGASTPSIISLGLELLRSSKAGLPRYLNVFSGGGGGGFVVVFLRSMVAQHHPDNDLRLVNCTRLCI